MSTYDRAIKEWQNSLKGKGHVCYDLDGSCAEYKKWDGLYHIGKPVPESIKRIKDFLRQGIEVKIFTARASISEEEGLSQVIEAIQEWTTKHIGRPLDVTCRKTFETIKIYDDLCEQLVPNTGLTLSEYHKLPKNL